MTAHEDEERERIAKLLPGWRIWYVYNWAAPDHAWSAHPLGALTATCTAETGGPDALVAKCLEYEANLETHILDAQAELESHLECADAVQTAGYKAKRDSLMDLRTLLTANAAGIELPV